MFKKRKRKEITSLDEIEVKLKNLGNIRAGVYLTILYTFIVFVILFLVFLLPGINNPGSLVSFTAVPVGSAVYVDGKYVGNTPCSQYISEGKHSVTIGKNNFVTYEGPVEIERRLFGSLIFPKKKSVAIRLKIQSVEGLLAETLQKYAIWADIDSFHYGYQPDMIISNTMEDLLWGRYPVSIEQLDTFLMSALPYSVDETLLRDLTRGFMLTKSNGQALTPNSLLEVITSVLSTQNNFGNLPFWLVHQLSNERADYVINTSWYEQRNEEYQSEFTGSLQSVSSIDIEDLQRVSFEGIDFIFVPGDTYSLGGTTLDSFPVVYHSGPFYISAGEISYLQLAAFIRENPQFHPDNLELLIIDKLVTREYLSDWNEKKDTHLPVTHISSFVADAFCNWLDTKMPQYVKEDFTVSLPNEYQWEIAAGLSDKDNIILFTEGKNGPKPVNRHSGNGLYDFLGNVWEWCDNWYAPADFVQIQSDGKKFSPPEYLQGVSKSVRGGSWAVIEDLVSIRSRGSQPPEWCTPFLGFRPAIISK